MSRTKKIFLNNKQRRFINAQQKTRCFVGGRGSGKSTCIGVVNRMRASVMPRAKVFFASTTYNQILTKTLPAIENMWQMMGMQEDIHYVVGKRPPKHFDLPYSPPRNHTNVISLMNGYCIEMLSMDRADLARGGSYDGGDIDEAALVNSEDFQKILIPSIRGNSHRFRTHWHQNVNLYTTIPWKPSGFWIFDFEEKAKIYPDEYYYIESTAYDNIEILTQKGIDRMQREMGYLAFQVEVMNKRITKVEDGFYSALDEDKHGYTPTYEYGQGERGITVTGTKDVDKENFLELSFDFSGWFNCVTIWQESKGEEHCKDALHVKGSKKLDDLIDLFANKYKGHHRKFVRIWGEPRGHDRQPMTPSIYESLTAMFNRKGWQVEISVPPGRRTSNHKDRHTFVNEVLSESNPSYPKVRWNEDSCKDVIIAMNSTQVRPDFTKDKSKEKIRSFPQEHAPHYTDTVDYYLVQKHGWRTMNHGNVGAGEAMII